MSNALQTGAERVVKANNNMRLIADDLAADPGIKALVELVQSINAGSSAYWGVAATAALRIWETGK